MESRPKKDHLVPDRAVRHIPLTHGKSAVVDASDYDMLAGFKWRAVRIRQTWYAHTYVATGAEEFMHRLIMGARPGTRLTITIQTSLNCQ